MKSEYYPDIEKKDLFRQGYIGNSFQGFDVTFGLESMLISFQDIA